MHSGRSCGVVLGALFALFSWADARATTLDTVVRKAHEAGQFDGVVLVGRDDAVTYRRAVGLADRIAQVPHTPGESWRWLSISEQVAAVLVLQDVERGRLALDAPISRYLPGFGGQAVGRVTLRQLLQHASGLANPDDAGVDERGVPTAYRANGLATTPKAMLEPCAAAPKSAPNLRYEANTCDTLVLAAVLEHVNGARYAQLVSSRIAKPLGLASLTMLPPNGSPTRSGVLGHDGEGAREAPYDAGRYGAAGALQGTLDDLWRFDRALMGFLLLSKPVAATMGSGNPRLGNAALGGWSYMAKPKQCAEPVGVFERRSEIGGVRAVNLLVPARQLALVAFSNTANTDWGQLSQGSGLLHDLLDAALCAPDAPVAPPPKDTGGRGKRRATTPPIPNGR